MARDNIDLQERDHDMMVLNRLLGRLEHKLLSSADPPQTPTSSYERRKIGANIEYAHNLILHLEHASSSAKTRDRKTRPSQDLQPKRILLRKLQNRLHELDQQDDGHYADYYATGVEEEDLLSRYAPASTTVTNGETAMKDTGNISTSLEKQLSDQQQADSRPTSTLRARHGAEHASEDTALSTGSSLANDRARLLSGRREQTTAEAGAEDSGNDKLLAHHTSEQENITSSLLNLASALKQSTLSFSDEIAESNPLVDRATASLDKNVTGMESAERRMGMLRKMTEGRGWWARLGLYGWIAALWVILILVMFVMPKLRF